MSSTTVSIRSNEYKQLDELLPMMVEYFRGLGLHESAAHMWHAHEQLGEEMTLDDDAWQSVILGMQAVRDEYGRMRTDYLQHKLVWRAVEGEDKIQPIIARI